MNEVNYRNEGSKASDSPPNISTTKPRHVTHVWSRRAGANAAHGLSWIVLDCPGLSWIVVGGRPYPAGVRVIRIPSMSPLNRPCHVSIQNICSDVLCKATRETIPNEIRSRHLIATEVLE
jgi:hypothetical protein